MKVSSALQYVACALAPGIVSSRRATEPASRTFGMSKGTPRKCELTIISIQKPLCVDSSASSRHMLHDPTVILVSRVCYLLGRGATRSYGIRLEQNQLEQTSSAPRPGVRSYTRFAFTVQLYKRLERARASAAAGTSEEAKSQVQFASAPGAGLTRRGSSLCSLSL